MKLQYLISGTGRCGTVYLARVLTSVGIPCGHESVFDYMGIKAATEKINGLRPAELSECSQGKYEQEAKALTPIPKWLDDVNSIQAESSYLAAPHLDNPILDRVKFIHVVRNPIDVVNSFCNNIYYFNGPEGRFNYEKFIYSHIPELGKPMSQYERACMYYIKWNQMIERKLRTRDSIFYKVEDDISPVLRFIGKGDADKSKVFSDSKINTFERGNVNKFSLNDLPKGQLKSDFITIGRKYGYTLGSEHFLI